MIPNRISFYAQREQWSGFIALHIGAVSASGVLQATADPIAMRVAEPGARTEPALSLTQEAAQQLMDELWHVGLRPSEGTGSAGALAATQKHLDDMQGIAIGLLRRDGVEL